MSIPANYRQSIKTDRQGKQFRVSSFKMTENNPTPTRWSIIFVALAAGVIVAGYIGKTPPAIPGMRVELSLSLITAGWVVSIFSALGCAAGMMVGGVADRIGRVSMILYALGILSAGSILGAFAQSATILLLSRLIEGAGYIGTMAILPALIAQLASDRDRGLAVSLWSSVTPLGMAIAMVAAPAIIEPVGWRGLWLATAGLTIFFLLLCGFYFRGIDTATTKNREPYWNNIKKTVSAPGPWLISICFITYTLQWMAIMVWLPTFVIEERGLGLGLAASLAAAGVIINIFGNLFGAWLVHRGVARWLMITIGTGFMGGTSLLIFPDLLPDILRFVMVLIFSFHGRFATNYIVSRRSGSCSLQRSARRYQWFGISRLTNRALHRPTDCRTGRHLYRHLGIGRMVFMYWFSLELSNGPGYPSARKIGFFLQLGSFDRLVFATF